MRLLRRRVEINASVDAVWSVLEDFGSVSRWAPYMRYSALIGDQQSGIGTRRELRHFWGFRLEESVTEWTDREGFSFDVVRAPYPMKNVKETWVVEHGNEHTVIATAVEYSMRLGPIGALLDWFLVRHIVLREMRIGLMGLKDYTENNFTLTGTATESNPL